MNNYFPQPSSSTESTFRIFVCVVPQAFPASPLALLFTHLIHLIIAATEYHPLRIWPYV